METTKPNTTKVHIHQSKTKLKAYRSHLRRCLLAKVQLCITLYHNFSSISLLAAIFKFCTKPISTFYRHQELTRKQISTA